MSYRIVLAQRSNHRSEEDGRNATLSLKVPLDESSSSNFHNIAAGNEPAAVNIDIFQPAVHTTPLPTPSSPSTFGAAKLVRQERIGRDKATLVESMAIDVLTQRFQDALNTIIHSLIKDNNPTNQNNDAFDIVNTVASVGNTTQQPPAIDGKNSYEDSVAMASSVVSGSGAGSIRYGTSVRSGGVGTSKSWGKGGASSVSRGTSRSTKSKKDERRRRLDKLRSDEHSKKNSWRVEAQVLLFTMEQDIRDQLEEIQLLDFVEITQYYFVDFEGNFFKDVQKRLYQSKDTVLPKRLTHAERAMMMSSRSFSSQKSLVSIRSSATSHSLKMPPHLYPLNNQSLSSRAIKQDSSALVSCVEETIDDDPVLLRKKLQHIPILQGLVRELITTPNNSISPNPHQLKQDRGGQCGDNEYETMPLSQRLGAEEEHRGVHHNQIRRDSLHSVASTEYEMDGNSEWEMVGGKNGDTAATPGTTIFTDTPALMPFVVVDPHLLQLPNHNYHPCHAPHSTGNTNTLDVSLGLFPNARATTAAGPGSFENTECGRLGKPPSDSNALLDVTVGVGNPTTLSLDQQPVVCYNGVQMKLRQRRLGPVVYQYQQNQNAACSKETTNLSDDGFEAVNEESEEEDHEYAVPDEEVEELQQPCIDEEIEEQPLQEHNGNDAVVSDADRDVLLLQRFHYSKSTRAAMLYAIFEVGWRALWRDQTLEFTALVGATSPFLSVQSRKVSVIKSSQVFVDAVSKCKDELTILERVEWRRLISQFWKARRNLLSQQKAELIVGARDVITDLLRQERRERSRLLVCEVPCHPLFYEFKASVTSQELVPLRYAWRQWVSTFEATSSARKVVQELKRLERHCSHQLSQRYLVKLMYFTRNQVLERKLDRIRSDAEQPLMNQCFEVMKAPAAVKVAGRRIRMHVFRSRAVCLHTLLGGYFSKWLDIYQRGHPPIPPPQSAPTTSPSRDAVSDGQDEFVVVPDDSQDDDATSKNSVTPTTTRTTEHERNNIPSTLPHQHDDRTAVTDEQKDADLDEHQEDEL